MSFSGSRNWFVCRCYKRSMYRVLSRISSLGGKIQKVMVGVSSAEIGEYSISQLPIERKSFWTGCSVLEGPQVGQCFYGDWHKECVWNYDWAGRVYKSACNDIEQQTQFQGSLLLRYDAERIKKCDVVTAPWFRTDPQRQTSAYFHSA